MRRQFFLLCQSQTVFEWQDRVFTWATFCYLIFTFLFMIFSREWNPLFGTLTCTLVHSFIFLFLLFCLFIVIEVSPCLASTRLVHCLQHLKVKDERACESFIIIYVYIFHFFFLSLALLLFYNSSLCLAVRPLSVSLLLFGVGVFFFSSSLLLCGIVKTSITFHIIIWYRFSFENVIWCVLYPTSVQWKSLFIFVLIFWFQWRPWNVTERERTRKRQTIAIEMKIFAMIMIYDKNLEEFVIHLFP